MTARGLLPPFAGALLWLLAPATWAQFPADTAGALTVLTNAEQIAALGTNIPPDQYQARLEGVVIYVSPPTRRLYVQNGDRGVQVNLEGSVAPYRVGQRVEAEGTVLGGLAALRLVDCQARILGEAPLPEPKVMSPHRLAAGAEPYRFASVRGFIRDMTSDRNTLILQVAYEGLIFEALVPARQVALPREWLDAEVELQGFSWTVFNNAGRASGFRFHLPGTNYVRVLRPGTAEPFDQAPLTCAAASRLPSGWGPRIKIQGTVTVHRLGGSLFVDDGTGVMNVELLPPLAVPATGEHLRHEPQTWLQPGERVEIIGVRHNWYSLTPTLLQAEYRRLGKGAPVRAREVSVRELADGKHAGRLVTFEARLLDQRQWNNLRLNYQALVLRNDDQVLQARWESETPAKWDLKLDEYVRVTGVNDAEGSASGKRSTFQILLRSPGDIQPARPPAFWSRPEIHRALLAAGGVALVAAAWIILQRLQMHRLERRVLDRTSELREANVRLRSEVAAREKAQKDLHVALEAEQELNRLKSGFVSMVSHEFRTPLEVILSSSHILDRYLDRLPSEKRREQLRAIRKSVHRMSDLMEDVLTLGKFEAARMTCAPSPVDLPALCRRYADEIQSASDSACSICLTCAGLEGEAKADEALLGPILANLLSNAVKYSPRGAAVSLEVSRHGASAEFLVRDSGCGIPAADLPHLFTAFHRASNVSHIPGNGLGLVIVRRCVELHGGSIRCESEEGKGTTFFVSLPLFDGAALSQPTPPARGVTT